MCFFLGEHVWQPEQATAAFRVLLVCSGLSLPPLTLQVTPPPSPTGASPSPRGIGTAHGAARGAWRALRVACEGEVRREAAGRHLQDIHQLPPRRGRLGAVALAVGGGSGVSGFASDRWTVITKDWDGRSMNHPGPSKLWLGSQSPKTNTKEVNEAPTTRRRKDVKTSPFDGSSNRWVHSYHFVVLASRGLGRWK